MGFRERTVGARTSEEFSYYLSSREADAAEFARVIRQHWSIESLHWVSDVTFREDSSRVRVGHWAENFGLLRRLAVSLLKQDDSMGSLKGKRLRAGWDNEFLLRILLNPQEFQQA